MPTLTRSQEHGRRIRQRFFSQIESRAWQRPSQLRIGNPDRIPAPIYTHIRFPIGRGAVCPHVGIGGAAPPQERPPGGWGPPKVAGPDQASLPRSDCSVHMDATNAALLSCLRVVSRPRFSALLPICASPRFVLRTPSAVFVSYLRPTTQTRDRKTSPKLDPLAKGHSIDAIPSCPHFTAYRVPNLDRDGPGTEEGKNARSTIQFNANSRTRGVCGRGCGRRERAG